MILIVRFFASECAMQQPPGRQANFLRQMFPFLVLLASRFKRMRLIILVTERNFICTNYTYYLRNVIFPLWFFDITHYIN